MTEEEAKTKWCPFVRLTADQGEWHTSRDPSLPSNPGDTRAYRCIASACMAWRFGSAATDRQEWVEFGELRVRPGDTGPSSGEWRDLPEGKRRGYCGLAGAQP